MKVNDTVEIQFNSTITNYLVYITEITSDYLVGYWCYFGSGYQGSKEIVTPFYFSWSDISGIKKSNEVFYTVPTLKEDDIKRLIEVRAFGNFRDRSFYLNSVYRWRLEEDNEGITCLIPTRVKGIND